MKVALVWTINDFLTYKMLLGWSTIKKLSKMYYMDLSKAFKLKNERKNS